MESCSDINSLPEDCLANILSLTSPTSPMDVCRLSAVSPTFSAAARSNVIWESLLPSDYRRIISRSLLNKFQSRKDLYMYLCDNPILIDVGRKSFWLDKRSGNKCYMLAARDLAIFASHAEHWRRIYHPESRFSQALELVTGIRLDISGKINISMLSPGTRYAAYLVYHPHSVLFNGFRDNPIEAIVGTGKKRKQNKIFLKICHRTDPKRRSDGWTEVELGELFTVGGEDVEFEIRLMEVETGNWKSGLVVQGIEIRPKNNSRVY